MKAIFIIYDNNNKKVGWARNLIEAIGNKEYFERHGYNNLIIKRYNEDNKQYKEIINSVFGR